VPHKAAILSEPAISVSGWVGREKAVDDHRQDGNLARANGIGKGDVNGGVLQRREPSVENCLGERPDELSAPSGDLSGPLNVVEPDGAVALV
jgi:hypothetical protein